MDAAVPATPFPGADVPPADGPDRSVLAERSGFPSLPATGRSGFAAGEAEAEWVALLGRAQAGDPEAFGDIVRRHTDRVYQLLWRWTGNRADAEDLTQETFVRAYASLGRLDPARPFLPWLYTIARRAAASHWRRARPVEPLTDDLPEPSTPETPATHMEGIEGADAIWERARRLKPKQYQALWLRFGEGLSVAETARVLGITRLHVRVLLHRARAALTSQLS